MDLRTQLIQAAETFVDLLENEDLTDEQFEELVDHFDEIIENQEWDEDSMSVSEIVDSHKILHSDVLEDSSKSTHGFIIALKNKDKRTVLDGNHRLNTLIKKNPNFRFKILTIELEF